RLSLTVGRSSRRFSPSLINVLVISANEVYGFDSANEVYGFDSANEVYGFDSANEVYGFDSASEVYGFDSATQVTTVITILFNDLRFVYML
ncbi:hypothetical protein L9F63_007907, partial [Diploptera punctata]